MKIVQPIGTLAGTAISRIAVMLAEEFVRQGHESTLVVWNRDKIDFDIDPRVRIVRADIVGLSRRNILTKLLRLMFKTVLGNQIFMVFLAPLLSSQLQKKVLNELKPDVVLLHAHAVFGFRRITSPFVVAVHSTKSQQLLAGKAPWKQRWLTRIYRRVYSGKHLLTVSQGIADDLLSHFKVEPASMSVIYNPLDMPALRRQGEESGAPEGAYVIALGRNTPAKRFDRLLRIYAAAGISERLVILGRANENPELHELADSLGISDRVDFAGFKSNPYPYIANARCLLLTSDYEGLPMVIIEALTLGTPVIATDCPSGPSEILGEDSDCLIPMEDEAAFAQRLARMMQEGFVVDPQLVARYDLPIVASNYVDRMRATLDNG